MWSYFLFGGMFQTQTFHASGQTKESAFYYRTVQHSQREWRRSWLCCVPPTRIRCLTRLYFYCQTMKQRTYIVASQIADTPAYMSWPVPFVYCKPTPKMRSGKKETLTHRERETTDPHINGPYHFKLPWCPALYTLVQNISLTSLTATRKLLP